MNIFPRKRVVPKLKKLIPVYLIMTRIGCMCKWRADGELNAENLCIIVPFNRLQSKKWTEAIVTSFISCEIYLIKFNHPIHTSLSLLLLKFKLKYNIYYI